MSDIQRTSGIVSGGPVRTGSLSGKGPVSESSKEEIGQQCKLFSELIAPGKPVILTAITSSGPVSKPLFVGKLECEMTKEKGCAVSFVVERNGFKDGEQAMLTAQSDKIFITAVGKLQIVEGNHEAVQQSWHENMKSVFPEGPSDKLKLLKLLIEQIEIWDAANPKMGKIVTVGKGAAEAAGKEQQKGAAAEAEAKAAAKV